MSTQLVQQDTGFEERFLKLTQKVDELPKKFEQGVLQVRMESGRIREVM